MRIIKSEMNRREFEAIVDEDEEWTALEASETTEGKTTAHDESAADNSW